MVGRKTYIICPGCGEVSDGQGWWEIVGKCRRYRINEEGKIEVVEEYKVAYVEHKCGERGFGIEDFVVVVEKGRIVYAGEVWDSPEMIEKAERIVAMARIIDVEGRE